MKSILSALGIVTISIGSLLTFPAHLHWMLAVWGALALTALSRGKPAWPWLAAGILIFVVKRPGYTFETWLVGLTFVTTAIYDIVPAKKRGLSDKSGSSRFVCYSIFLFSAVTIFGTFKWFGSNCSEQWVCSDRPIACLGDSLTDCGYPQELEKLVLLPVADFGVDGITTDDGIKMIPEILATDPQLVVIELGGHDYNAEMKTREATKTNLELLIKAFLNQEIAVILVEIPRGFITDPYGGIERELAAKYDLQLIDDSLIRRFIFFSPIIPPGSWLNDKQHLSDDGLHPNELGNKYFASVVRDALMRVLGNKTKNDFAE